MRAIVPAFIESSGILISSLSECNRFIEEKKDSAGYLQAIISGDIQNLYFGYAEHKRVLEFKNICAEILQNKELLLKSKILIPGIVDVDEEYYELCGGLYDFSSNEILNNTKLVGYHRQKTRISFPESMSVVSGITDFSYLLLKKQKRGVPATFTVNSGCTLKLSHLIVDSISIIVEEGAVLEVEDVDFKGAVEAIIQKGNGKIINKGNIRFDGVAFEYNYENLSSETAEGIIDLSSEREVKRYIETSKATFVHLQKSLDFHSLGPIEFKNEISFVNRCPLSEDVRPEISISFQEFSLRDNFGIGNFIHVSGKCALLDITDKALSLGRFTGQLIVEESKIEVFNTWFMPESGKSSIIPEFSTISVTGSRFEPAKPNGASSEKNVASAIQSHYSDICLENTSFKGLHDVFQISKHKHNSQKDGTKAELIEDELFEEDFSNSITFNNINIQDCHSIIKADSDMKFISGKNLMVKNIKNGFNIKNSHIKISGMKVSAVTGEFMHLTHSIGAFEGKEGDYITDTARAFHFTELSDTEMSGMNISNNKGDPAITLDGSRLIAHNSDLHKNSVAIYIMANGVFINNKCHFEGNTTTFKKDHGAKEVQVFSEWVEEIKKAARSQHV